ncbi:hypothetical protein FA95DRAFT_1605778 [Auriscalpium vulgare]|uniref:Uncharacterized protein n=1 Tax=Auriscalpium vulgare TaxID=40419 RepID=A0ACB8RV60_9AGAM|nr:hypothetical protein FA95DRAFT_1605778 [Auriscalpium vulgare]
MLTVQPTTSHSPKPDFSVEMNELGDVHEALKPITELLAGSAGDDTLRLYCTVPTWSPTSDICIDLHDLNALRTRSLLFIHDLVSALRASGIPASYTLTPSNSPLCFICASHSSLDKAKVQRSAHEAYIKTKSGVREKVLLVQLKHGPALVLT